LPIFNYGVVPVILTRRRGEWGVISKFRTPYVVFFIFIIKIYMKEEYSFLITYSSLRPLRLCVMNFFDSLLRGIFGVNF